MSIQQRLDIKQSQSLTMTPQLQQAIKLLQMSSMELQDYIEEELVQNPLLERDDTAVGERVDPNTETDKALEWDEKQRTEDQLKQLEERRRNEKLDNPDEWTGEKEHETGLDTDYDNVFTGESVAEKQNDSSEKLQDFDMGSDMANVGKGGSMTFEHPDFSLENRLADEKNLREYLAEQMILEIPENKDRMVGMALIDQLDDAGYLREDLAELSKIIGCDEKRLEKVLLDMQKLQPTGVFSRDLSECLALQLKELDRFDPAMEKLLQNLDMLAAHDLKRLSRICRVDMDDLRDMIVEIQSLNPKPGADFSSFVSQTAIPDVVMKSLPKDQGGGWGVELNADMLPKLLVNRRYYTEVRKDVKDKKDKEYLSEQMNSAKWLLKTLDQRANTILKVSAEIVRRQEAFFAYGVEYLKPMVLRDVAEAIEMHESTVSRVTNNKFIGTPRGIFELRYFFSRGISSADENGADHSSESVKARLKALVDAEDPKKILSDDKLVKLLKEAGIDIARRTVAKYREAMNIPSSVQRRRMKNT